MHQTRNHLLANAAFASQQDLGVGPGRLAQLLVDLEHRRADGNHRASLLRRSRAHVCHVQRDTIFRPSIQTEMSFWSWSITKLTVFPRTTN